ncbi:HIT family protein [Prolixibacter denitrificans]|uniref:HIT family protein n=1 Tax=Prolixibacter denitrificans TaxID=1541063 RepID=A0A2P8CKS8_9BACT|nr:HIT family protein [Prolixibacter denitrificans]PSK85564.1 histidine triad (HIT) family protein [Prolixibacter denitrificans]GET20184.1 HIT family protein [Prolixibacter denitrificans]
MASIFTKIVEGEIPAYKVAEDENYLAFLDIFPLAKGHVLVIPKKEVDYLFDLDDELYIGLQLFAKRVAAALKKAIPCKKVGVAVLGLEVPHAHIHLVPMQSEKDINFSNPKLKLSEEEFKEITEKIKKEL